MKIDHQRFESRGQAMPRDSQRAGGAVRDVVAGRHMSARALGLAALLALGAAPAGAGAPGLEQAKAESGLRFSESAGLGERRGETSAVWAGDTPARREGLALSRPKARKHSRIPAPRADGEGAGTVRGSGRFRDAAVGVIAAAAGIAAATAATALFRISVETAGSVAMAVGHAVAGGWIAYRSGARGTAFIGKVIGGASAGQESLTFTFEAVRMAAKRALGL